MLPRLVRSRLTLLRSHDGETGSTLPLIIFYGFLSLVLILLVVSATSLYLERKRLFTVADGAALVGAEAFDLDTISLTPDGPRPVLTAAQIDASVRRYLREAPRGDLESLALDGATTIDGRSATVTMSAYWRPPVLSLLVPEGIRMNVTSVARSVFF